MENTIEIIQGLQLGVIVLITVIIFLGVTIQSIWSAWQKDVKAFYSFQENTISQYKELNRNEKNLLTNSLTD